MYVQLGECYESFLLVLRVCVCVSGGIFFSSSSKNIVGLLTQQRVAGQRTEGCTKARLTRRDELLSHTMISKITVVLESIERLLVRDVFSIAYATTHVFQEKEENLYLDTFTLGLIDRTQRATMSLVN